MLVLVELNGGNDGLNTVIPFKDPEYAKLRPTLKQPESAIKKITDDLALHPNLGELAKRLATKLIGCCVASTRRGVTVRSGVSTSPSLNSKRP